MFCFCFHDFPSCSGSNNTLHKQKQMGGKNCKFHQRTDSCIDETTSLCQRVGRGDSGEKPHVQQRTKKKTKKKMKPTTFPIPSSHTALPLLNIFFFYPPKLYPTKKTNKMRRKKTTATKKTKKTNTETQKNIAWMVWLNPVQKQHKRSTKEVQKLHFILGVFFAKNYFPV